VAVEPAVIFAELELPEAMANPSVGLAPIPDSAAVWGLFGALSVMVRVPVDGPEAAGANIICITQPAPAPLQVSVSVKGPVIWIFEICRATVPSFVTEIFCRLLAVPISWLGKDTLGGEIVTDG